MPYFAHHRTESGPAVGLAIQSSVHVLDLSWKLPIMAVLWHRAGPVILAPETMTAALQSHRRINNFRVLYFDNNFKEDGIDETTCFRDKPAGHTCRRPCTGGHVRRGLPAGLARPAWVSAGKRYRRAPAPGAKRASVFRPGTGQRQRGGGQGERRGRLQCGVVRVSGQVAQRTSAGRAKQGVEAGPSFCKRHTGDSHPGQVAITATAVVAYRATDIAQFFSSVRQRHR